MPASATGHAKVRRAHWPDRVAHRHRRRAHKVFLVVAALLLVLPWFGYRYVRQLFPGSGGAGVAPASAISPAPAATVALAAPKRTTATVTAARGATPAPPASVRAAAPNREDTENRLAAVREGVISGDDTKVSESVEALDQAARSAMRLADRGSAVHRIEARTLVREMPGVRAAGWIDPVNMLVVVSGAGMRNRSTIDGVCDRLGRRGDPSGIVVNVQDGTASTPARAGMLSGACQSTAGNRRIARAPAAASLDADPALQAARAARRAESMRILEESTPELPAEVPIAPPGNDPVYLQLDPPPEPAPVPER